MFTGFEPDPDITDPTDPYFGTGTWRYQDGTSMYGQGDPEEARRLWKPPAPPASDPDGAGPAPPPMLERPRQPDNATPPVQRAAPPTAGVTPGGGIEIPRESRIAWVHNNPGNLKYVGQEGASRGEPAEDGGHWAAFESPEEGLAALQRQVQLDASRGMTTRQFIGKYAPPSSNDTDTYIRQASQQLGVDPDTPLGDVPTDAVVAFMAQKESNTRLGGSGSSPSGGLQPPGASAPRVFPPSVSGMPAALAEVRGMPMSPDQMQDRQRAIYESTMQQASAVQQAAQERQRGREEAVAIVKDQHDRFMAEQQQQLAVKTAAKLEAQKNVEQAMATQLDPGRVIKNMSTGDMVLGAVALALGGLGQTLQQRGGQQGAQNGALLMMQKAIADDIEAQKEDKRSRVAHWTRVFNDQESGIAAARAEMFNAAGQFAQFQAQQKAGNADIQAQMMQDSAALIAAGQKETQSIMDREAERITMRYAPPDPKIAGALGGGGTVPQIARVGVEDRDQETRDALANAYNPSSPTDRSQMVAMTKEMQQITKLEQTLDGLKQWYGVGTEKEDYDSSATGPWWNPGNWADNDEKDRALRDLWAQVELDTRSGWQTEPNGEVKQVELSGINRPKRDNETPNKLRDLEEEIKRRKEAIMSGTNAPVRAAWKYQNGYPLQTSGGGRPVTGRVQR